MFLRLAELAGWLELVQVEEALWEKLHQLRLCFLKRCKFNKAN
jgi:hypothetical protein